MFALTDGDVATLSPSGGSCFTKFSTATSFSVDDHKRVIEAAITLTVTTGQYSPTLSGWVHPPTCRSSGDWKKAMAGGSACSPAGGALTCWTERAGLPCRSLLAGSLAC